MDADAAADAQPLDALAHEYAQAAGALTELRNGMSAQRAARLLVVDDNKVNRLLLTRSLELQGHRVASAENGRVALEMLRREAFDLMLLDMEMPEMDGFQVLEQLSQGPAAARPAGDRDLGRSKASTASCAASSSAPTTTCTSRSIRCC